MKSFWQRFHWRYRITWWGLGALTGMMIALSGCIAAESTASATPAACAARVIVRFQSGLDPSDKALLRQLGLRIHATLTYDHAIGGDQHVLQLSSAQSDCGQAITALQRDAQIITAEPDSMKRATH